MRVSIEHHEGSAPLLGTERSYYVECTLEFSEEEKAVIVARGLADHFIEMPKGYSAVFDPTDQKRLYALKIVCAVVAAFLGVTIFSNTGLGAVIFIASCGYAAYCLYRLARPKLVDYQRLPLRLILKHRKFTLAAPDPVRAKEIESSLWQTVEGLKSFLLESTDLGTRTVREV